MVQIPLAGGGDRFCKLTFPPSRASAEVVSYDSWDPAQNPERDPRNRSLQLLRWRAMEGK